MVKMELEENYNLNGRQTGGKSESRQPSFQSKFKHGTSGIQSRSINHANTMFFILVSTTARNFAI